MFKIISAMLKYSPLGIAFVWMLDAIDILFSATMPWIIGLAIDGLLTGNHVWFFAFVAIEITMLLSSSLNRYIDTRIYSKIIEKFSVDYYDSEIKKGIGMSIISARLQLIDDFSGFLESGLVNIIGTIIGIIVPAIYIATNAHIYVSFTSIIVSFSVLIITIKVKKKIMLIHKSEKDLREQEHNILRKKKTLRYQKYINNILRFGIKKSDLDSISYLLAFLLQTFLLSFALFLTAFKGDLLPGTIFSTLTYLKNFNDNVLEVSEHWWYIIDLKESAKRIAT